MRIGIFWIGGILLLSFSASGQVETLTKLVKQQEMLHNTQAYQESIELGEKTLLDLSAKAASSLDTFKTQVLYLLCQSNGSMQNYDEAKVRCQEYRAQVKKTAGSQSAAYFEAQFLEILLRQLEGEKEGIMGDYHALIATKDNYDEPLENILGLLYSKMGSYSLRVNEYESAIAYYEQAEYYWLEAVNCRDIAAIYETLAAYFQKKGWLEKAMVYFQKALAIYYEEGNIWAGVYSNIAVNYSKMGDLEKAAEYNEKAIATGGMNLEDLRSTYNNLGGNYLDLGQNEKAQSTFEKAIRLGDSFQGRFAGGAISIIRLAIAHWRLGRHEKAYQLWQDILVEAKSKEQFVITIFAAAEWAKAKSSLGEHLEALEIWGYGYPALTGDYSQPLNNPLEELMPSATGANLYAARYW
ncbi:MAG: tetratricopeptide repeat protein, partial [Bacteroidota bacterium]